MVEERAAGHTVYNQPAGHLEPGESLTAAARRETLEETGWEVRIDAFLGLYHFISAADQISYVRSCFTATALQQLPERKLDADIIRTHWMTANEIRMSKDRLRSPVVLKVLEDYLAGISWPVSVVTTLQ